MSALQAENHYNNEASDISITNEVDFTVSFNDGYNFQVIADAKTEQQKQ